MASYSDWIDIVALEQEILDLLQSQLFFKRFIMRWLCIGSCNLLRKTTNSPISSYLFVWKVRHFLLGSPWQDTRLTKKDAVHGYSFFLFRKKNCVGIRPASWILIDPRTLLDPGLPLVASNYIQKRKKENSKPEHNSDILYVLDKWAQI